MTAEAPAGRTGDSGGEARCRCGHRFTDHDVDEYTDEGCLKGWEPGHVWVDDDGCPCPSFRLAAGAS